MFSKNQIILLIIICILSVSITAVSAILLLNPNNTSNFRTYLNDYKINFENYILGENESNYNELLEQSKQAINSKDTNKIAQLRIKLKDLEKKVVSENNDTINNGLSEIEAIDTSKLPADKKKKIYTQLDEVNKLIADKNFLKANIIIGQIKITLKTTPI